MASKSTIKKAVGTIRLSKKARRAVKPGRKPEPGSAASLKKIAAGDENKVATHAARRVLAKRAARAAGNDVKVHSNETVEPVLLKFKGGKGGKVFLKTLPDGRQMLSGGEPLPDPHTKRLKLDEDIVVEMNARWRGYRYLSMFRNDREVDARIRLDFVKQGGLDTSIVFNPKANGDEPYTRVVVKGKRNVVRNGK